MRGLFWGLEECIDFRDAFIVVFRAIFRWCKQDEIFAAKVKTTQHGRQKSWRLGSPKMDKRA